jgi:hypothetical protein
LFRKRVPSPRASWQPGTETSRIGAACFRRWCRTRLGPGSRGWLFWGQEPLVIQNRGLAAGVSWGQEPLVVANVGPKRQQG